jgi:hypothetical protein
MSSPFQFLFKKIRFDEDYSPAESTRLTTNFANLARGEKRRENLRNTLRMINNRFNALAHWDNPNGDRYSVAIDIASFDIAFLDTKRQGDGNVLPMIEMLQTTIVDHHNNRQIEGIFGNSFSSYVRDYDFSVLQLAFKEKLAHKDKFDQVNIGTEFGELHGKLFKALLASDTYQQNVKKQPVICLSVSSFKTYYRMANIHPVLGVEYSQSEYSPTDQYFTKMGLRVRYFMPQGSVAPLAFYFSGDLLSDYTNLELISAISVMESFQKIYRPEIYNANAPAGHCFKPSLSHADHSLTNIAYDRVERSQLAVKQGTFTQENFIEPNRELLTNWVASCTL